MRKIVITGGAGFIGSHVVEAVAGKYPDIEITVLDKMTYAADIDNLDGVLKRGQRRLVVGDLTNFDLCRQVVRDADCVINLAAESHVDNSFGNSLQFTHSNTLGTHTLLEACRIHEVPLIVHVSTDEVYGQIHEGFHRETDILDPTNPYSASKAAADMIVNSYVHCFKAPVISVRANNIYGVRQYPEKIIPRFTILSLLGEKLPIHGNGKNLRRYLSAVDFADAILVLLEKGQPGQIYNIGSDDEFSNLEVSNMILEAVGRSSEEAILFVNDRPFNDFRYAIDCSKLRNLGWRAKRPLVNHIDEVVGWYRDNMHRYVDIFPQARHYLERRDAAPVGLVGETA